MSTTGGRPWDETPSLVPRYRTAFGQAGIQRVPRTPPPLTVRPTAHQRRRQVNWVLVGSAVLVVVVMLGLSEDGRLSWTGVVGLLATAAGCAGALLWTVRRWGRAQLAELEHGYTTSTIHLGQFWVGRPPGPLLTSGWVQWDWSALWVLGQDGKVRSAPQDGAGEPPGFYPSPHHPDLWELWTGCMWTGVTQQGP